jgi:hypothetical protein
MVGARDRDAVLQDHDRREPSAPELYPPQKVEARRRLQVLNRMTALGVPVSKVA